MKILHFLFLFCAVKGPAQTTLTGFVTLQNSGKLSAFPAQVKAWGATATDVRSVDGAFSLVFDHKQPGDDAWIEVAKPGYEVVNREALQVRLPDNNTVHRPLKIYLCPIGQWQHYADAFYGVNLREITKTYQKQKAEIEEKYRSAKTRNQEYYLALNQLEESRKAAEAQAQSLAEKFARANLDDASDRFRLAYRLFSEGKIDSVLIVLKEEELLHDLEIAEAEIRDGAWLDSIGKIKEENGLKAITAGARTLVIKGRLHALHGEWLDAERDFKTALEVDSLNPVLLDEYERFISGRREKDPAYPPAQALSDYLDLAEKAIQAGLATKQEAIRDKARGWVEQAAFLLQAYPESAGLSDRLEVLKSRLNK